MTTPRTERLDECDQAMKDELNPRISKAYLDYRWVSGQLRQAWNREGVMMRAMASCLSLTNLEEIHETLKAALDEDRKHGLP